MKTRSLCLVTCALLAAAQLGWPQSSTADASKAVLATVETLMKAVREGDAGSAAAVLHPSYRVASWQGSGDERQLFLDTREGELAAISKLKPGEWDVRFLKTRVSIDPNGMANVWAKYEFYSFGQLKHCGVESYELLRTANKWSVINFTDTDTPVRGRQSAVVCPD